MEDNRNISQGTVVLVPSVSSSYGHGWRQLWKYFLKLFLIGLISFVIGIIPNWIGGWSHDDVGLFQVFFGIAYSILIAGPVNFGVSFCYLKAARGDTLEIGDMFEASENYRNAVLAYLLSTVIVVVGFILLIVPGIIFACKLAFTPYLVVDRKMAVLEAVKGSWSMTSGHAGKVFLIGLLAVPISIAGLICFGIGIIVSFMWISMAFASLYYVVSLSGEASALEGVPVT